MADSRLEQKARELDNYRRSRIIKADEIDVDKYLRANDVGHKVKRAEDWIGEIRDEFANPVRQNTQQMPWPKMHGRFEFREGEVTVYAGGNGGGKSLITGQIALGLVKQNQSVCMASFEMKPKRTLMRMLRQFVGRNIESSMVLDRSKYIGNLLERFNAFSQGRLWLYDQQGTVKTSMVIAMTRYCAVELGVKHVFIDSLMKCVSGEDDYNAQKNFVDELTAVARDHSIHFHLIHHIRKLQNEEVMPSKSDLKGSGSISDQVDNVLLMWRNKKKEHQIQAGAIVSADKPDAMLMCEKQRNGEAEEWYNLWYHNDSQQFVEMAGGVPMAFDQKGEF